MVMFEITDTGLCYPNVTAVSHALIKQRSPPSGMLARKLRGDV